MKFQVKLLEVSVILKYTKLTNFVESRAIHNFLSSDLTTCPDLKLIEYSSLITLSHQLEVTSKVLVP